MVGFPNESAEYRAARDRLLEKEIGLRRVMEEVAAARRALPQGGLMRRTMCSTASMPTESRRR